MSGLQLRERRTHTLRCRRCERQFTRRLRVGLVTTCSWCGEPQPGPARLAELERQDGARLHRNARRRAAPDAAAGLRRGAPVLLERTG